MIEASDRAALLRALTTAGILCFAAWLLFLLRQLERVITVSEQRFAGPWDQRIEVLSFIVVPPNILLLVPSAICAVAATWLAGSAQELDQAILLRIVRWAANLMIGIAAISIISLIVNDNDNPNRIGDIAVRVSGALIAAAIGQVGRVTERSSPAG